MKKRVIALMIILVLVLSFVLTSCDIEKLDFKKYSKYQKGLTSVQADHLNEKAKTMFPEAFEQTNDLDSYDMTISIRLKSGSFIPVTASVDGVVTKNGSSYTGTADIKYAGIKLLEASYKNTDKGGRITIDESTYLDLPFNYGEVGSIIYLNLTEEIIANATYVYDTPETIMFKLTDAQTKLYFQVLFDFVQEQLDKNDVSELDFKGLKFDDSVVYVTIENGIATSYYIKLEGSTNQGKLECSFSGKLQIK